MKIGKLRIKFEKDEYRNLLEYHIQSSEDAAEFIEEKQKKWSNFLPEKELHIHEGYIMGLKFALRMLDDL